MKSKHLQISLIATLLSVFMYVFPTGVSAKHVVKNGENSPSVSFNWEARGPVNVGGKTTAILIDNRDESNHTIIIGSAAGGIWESKNAGKNWTPIQYDGDLHVTSLAQTADGNIYCGVSNVYFGTKLFLISGTGNSISAIEGSEWGKVTSLAAQGNNLFIGTEQGLKFYDGATFSSCSANGESLGEDVYEVKVNGAGKVIASVDKACFISLGDHNAFVLQSTGETGMLPAAAPEYTSTVAVEGNDIDPDIFYVSIAKVNGSLFGVYATHDGGQSWELILSGGATFDPFIYQNVGCGNNQNKLFSINFYEGHDALYIAARDLWFGFRPHGVEGLYDFGTNAVTNSSIGYTSSSYLHSFVQDIAFVGQTAYLATDGGVYKAPLLLPSMGMILFEKINMTLSNTMVNHVTADGDDNVVVGTEGTSVVLLGKNSNLPILASPLWNVVPSSDMYSYEGNSKFNFASLVNQDFYFYSRRNNEAFQMRRTEDGGFSFSDLTNEKMTGNRIVRDLLYWETFHAKYTPDTVKFYAYYDTDSTTSTHYNNWGVGDVVYGYSNHKFDPLTKYPLPFKLDRQLQQGDSVEIPDVIQSRTFAAVNNIVYMTDKVLNLSFPASDKTFWTQIAKIGNSENVNCVAISQNCEDLYFGTDSGRLYRIVDIDKYYVNTDTSFSFDPVEITSFNGQPILSIEVKPDDKETVLVTLGNEESEEEVNHDSYLYITHNATADQPQFTSIQKNLVKTPVYTALFPSVLTSNGELSSTGVIMIGTELGLYVMEGDGNWVLDDIVKNIKVTDIFQQNVVREGRYYPLRNPDPNDSVNLFVWKKIAPSVNNGTIYVGTMGKGVYQSGLYKTEPVESNKELPKSVATGNLNVYPNPTGGDVTVMLQSDANGKVAIEVFDVQGRRVLHRDVLAERGSNTYRLDLSQMNRGLYIIRFVQNMQVQTVKVIKK